MTMLAEVEKAIKELEERKNQLCAILQEAGWVDERWRTSIPESTVSTLDFDITFSAILPERRPLPLCAERDYQQWYSATFTIIAGNQPSRVAEFEAAYSPPPKQPEPGIKQLLAHKQVTQEELFRLLDLINTQFEILAAVPCHLTYSIHDIELTAYSVLMDDEIGAARHLLSRGFLRPAGALAGVILERHLKNLLRRHTPPIKYKQLDTLAPLNDLAKDDLYDVVTWRKIQHLTALRNLCDHDKDREPTKEEVAELVEGVSAILKNQNSL